MKARPNIRDSIKKSMQEKREEINLADFQLTKAEFLAEGQTLPLIIQPAMPGVNLASWAENTG